MNGNDNTLEQFLFEHRVSPTPEFSARIDVVCGQIQQRQANIRVTNSGQTNKKKRKARTTTRRAAFLAACFLILLAFSVLAIPSARAAVSDWISGWFSTADYMGQESGNRTAEPAMDAIITKVGDDGREIVLSDVYDSEGARNLAEHFGIRLDEVAYTGDTIYITGWFTGTSGKFLLDQRTGGDTVHEDSEYTEGNMMLTLPDGTVYYSALGAYFDDEMDQIASSFLTNGNSSTMQLANS